LVNLNPFGAISESVNHGVVSLSEVDVTHEPVESEAEEPNGPEVEEHQQNSD